MYLKIFQRPENASYEPILKKTKGSGGVLSTSINNMYPFPSILSQCRISYIRRHCDTYKTEPCNKKKTGEDVSSFGLSAVSILFGSVLDVDSVFFPHRSWYVAGPTSDLVAPIVFRYVHQGVRG